MQANAQLSPPSVAAEVAAGDVVTMPQVARQCASTRQGKPVHPSTPLRWVFDGVKTPDGRRVKLEACRCGGRWVTSKAAFLRFVERQTPSPRSDAAPQTTTPAQAAKRAERAGTELERFHGF
jgi:Protein of unknown function (DUF1580)